MHAASDACDLAFVAVGVELLFAMIVLGDGRSAGG
jgi:hypothetical protein